MDTFLIKAAQLIIALGFLVIIHEFGHFLFARIFGVKVEKFYIFFDPWTEIFRWRPKKYYGFFGKKKKLSEYDEAEESGEAQAENCASAESGSAPTPGTASDKKKSKKGFWNDTEYGIGWLPLGGYCKIAGMIDESMDTEQMKRPVQDWEFRAKPAWQRLLVMVAGVLFNFLLAIVIYAGLVYATGERYVPVSEARQGMIYSGEARKAGFHNGDIPLTADGKTLAEPGEARLSMLQARQVTVLRDGKKTTIDIPSDLLLKVNEEAQSDTAQVNFMMYRFPTRITQVAPGEGAAKANVKPGDEVLAINGIPTPSLDIFLETLKGHDNQTISLKVKRGEGASAKILTLPVVLSETSKMGVGLEVDPAAFYKTKNISYNIFQSIPRGIEMGTDKFTSYAKSMKLVFTKEGAKSIGGFGAIGSIFPEKWDWIAFWNITAFLSVALAFMNILPIPALDGGHILFLLIEMITGRKPSEKFMEWSTMIGMGLLILLLVYANGMDIVRLFK